MTGLGPTVLSSDNAADLVGLITARFEPMTTAATGSAERQAAIYWGRA